MHKRSARGLYTIDLAHPRCVGERTSASANLHDHSVARLHQIGSRLGLARGGLSKGFLQAKGCSRLEIEELPPWSLQPRRNTLRRRTVSTAPNLDAQVTIPLNFIPDVTLDGCMIVVLYRGTMVGRFDE